MGLTQALATSLAGLNATQASLGVVAGNVANAQTAGYIAQSVTQVATATASSGDSVRVASVNRLLDKFVQQQLWTETSGGSYADMKANLYQQLQQVYGQPGSSTTLDATFNNFTSAVQALSTSPNSTAAQSQTVATAQALAQQLNNATGSIQQLRSQADQGIANDVQQANNALQQIANINQQLAGDTTGDSATATLENQRDQYIGQLSQLMDIRVAQGSNNQVTVFTGSGVQLVGTQAAQLSFSQAGTMTAAEQWNADPSKSGLSGVTLISPSGVSIDLTANNGLRSGEIAAYINMRDTVLVQAQSQLDQIAAQMSKALSDTATAGTPVTSGSQAGFNVDIGGLSGSDTVQVTYTDSSNTQHIVNMGVDFSGGAASVASQLNAAFGSDGLQFSNPSGSIIQILNSGSATTVNAAAAVSTATSLSGGTGTLPLFTDGGYIFTGAVTASGDQTVGYAGRITVNSALAADPSKLTSYQAGTTAGDATRPNFIYNQLTSATLTYSPAAGIGGAGSAFQGSLSSYMSQVISSQSIAANAASNLQAGQDVVVSALQTRFNSTSAVNIDTEMSNLLTLQNSYGANARVMSTVKSMLDTLMQMM
jgi:flagellar hook-associated protein 1 FlgK